MQAEKVKLPAYTEWCSPSVFVQKKHGFLCFCSCYSMQNAVTARACHSLSQMDKQIGFLRNSNIFPTLYNNAGYD